MTDRAVVTGGSGFLGSHLCDSLLSAGFEVVCLDNLLTETPANVAPRMRADDGRAIPTFIGQALRGEPLTVHGDGSQTRSICYVTDTVRGILAVATGDLVGPVNIGNPEELPVLKLAELILDLTGSASEIVFTDRPVDDPAVRRPDTTLAAERLGWSAEVSPVDGLERTVNWWRDAQAAA